VISRVLGSTGKIKPPWFVRLFIHVPFLRRIPAGIVGIGVRPERVKSPARVRGDVVIRSLRLMAAHLPTSPQKTGQTCSGLVAVGFRNEAKDQSREFSRHSKTAAMNSRVVVGTTALTHSIASRPDAPRLGATGSDIGGPYALPLPCA
jgi:hypothetical protein